MKDGGKVCVCVCDKVNVVFRVVAIGDKSCFGGDVPGVIGGRCSKNLGLGFTSGLFCLSIFLDPSCVSVFGLGCFLFALGFG